MAKMTEVPVLIVGAGAVGCILSLELARRGIEYRCIDRMAGPGHESRAIALHARTIELLNLVDADLSRHALEHSVWCKGYVMHFLHDGRRTEVRPGLDYTTIDSRYNGIASHSQSITQRLVFDYASAQFDRHVEYATRFEDFTQDGDGVVARLTHLDHGDEEEYVRCRYLIAGDGINSRVRRGLGLSVKGQDYKGSFFQNLDIHLNGFPDWTDYFHYCVGIDHFLMVAPLPDGSFRLLLSDRGEATDPSLTPQQAFMRLLARHFDGVTMGEVVWHSKWETWVRLADTFRTGNVILAGDAAHVHSTTGGQGMNCCMQDAFNLGWKLALVLKGLADPALLDTYEAERRPVAEQVIWAASSLHDIFMTHGKDIAQRKQTMFEPGYTEKVVNYCSGVAYNYRRAEQETPSPDAAGLVPGDRIPDVDFEGGGTLFDRLRHSYFTLLVQRGAGPFGQRRTGSFGQRRTGPFGPVEQVASGDVTPALDALLTRHRAVLSIERLPQSAALAARFGSHDDTLFLVRPDGYLACRATLKDVTPVEAYLARVAGS